MLWHSYGAVVGAQLKYISQSVSDCVIAHVLEVKSSPLGATVGIDVEPVMQMLRDLNYLFTDAQVLFCM